MKSYRGGICRTTGKWLMLLQYDSCTCKGLWMDENGNRYLFTREETEDRLRWLSSLEIFIMRRDGKIK